MQTFSEIIRDARFKSRIKQKELAQGVGVTEMTIANYEAGKTTPTFAIGLKILKFLGIDIKKFIDEMEK